ncbi:MAG: pyridoxal phosphate-dependent class II aminotransferase [Clostridiales bacterium]|nr:pyridoxal phosphate-dependent class II aminotransferase [Clostridiales bacterium]
MLEHKEHFHGSDLEKIEKIYGIRKEDIISFSANVNPLGVSFKLKETLSQHIDAITTYPDREYTSLRECISHYVDAPAERILVGNGSTELISILMQILKPQNALIVGPTYSEYEREIKLSQGSCHYFRLPEEQDFILEPADLVADFTSDTDLLILCNPNNPTSSIIPRTVLRKILDICKQKGIFVMIDETYMEFAPDYEKMTAIPLTASYNNLIILRGISKFFAAPGLRLGYAICGNRDLIQEINQKKNPWTINSLAAIAGEIMFKDQDYIDATKKMTLEERSRMIQKLSERSDLHAYPSYGNFVLVKILREDITAMDLFEAAIRKNLMIRDCSSFPFLDEHFFRFCFMLPEQNDRLIDVLFQTLDA